MSENKISQLGAYVRGVLDSNGDGVITIKDFLHLFPNQAIAIAVIFVDLLVAVAEYRVWDFGFQLTGDPYKAIGFVLISAVPFYLGQLFWLYPRANGVQKFISVAMVGGSLYTSWLFGTADLTLNYDEAAIYQMVTSLTAVYIVGILGYILVDGGIKAHRLKEQAKAAAIQEKEYQEIVRDVLSELQQTLKMQKETEAEFDADAVSVQLERLRGKNSGLAKIIKPASQTPQTAPKTPVMPAYAAEVEDNLKDVNFTKGQDGK